MSFKYFEQDDIKIIDNGIYISNVYYSYNPNNNCYLKDGETKYLNINPKFIDIPYKYNKLNIIKKYFDSEISPIDLINDIKNEIKYECVIVTNDNRYIHVYHSKTYGCYELTYDNGKIILVNENKSNKFYREIFNYPKFKFQMNKLVIRPTNGNLTNIIVDDGLKELFTLSFNEKMVNKDIFEIYKISPIPVGLMSYCSFYINFKDAICEFYIEISKNDIIEPHEMNINDYKLTFKNGFCFSEKK